MFARLLSGLLTGLLSRLFSGLFARLLSGLLTWLLSRLFARLLTFRLGVLFTLSSGLTLGGIPFVFQGLSQFAQGAFGELEGFGLVAKYAFGGFLDAVLEVVELALRLVAERLGGFLEITFTEAIDELLLFGFAFDEFLQVAEKRIVSERLFLFAKKLGCGVERFLGLFLVSLAKGVVEFSVEQWFGEFGLLDHFLYLVEEIVELVLLSFELFHDLFLTFALLQ